MGALLAPTGRAGADDEPGGPPDLSDLSLEELAHVEIVHAPARRDQEQRRVPSSVTVVTADQIHRSGFRTLADVLRSVAGFYVTDDRNYSYVGVRGFGRPGDYNTRILLLIDGFRVNDNIYDMAAVGYDFPVDLDLVQRVEVVRGPGASMYGNSAFFAVVNVVTKRGRDVGHEMSAGGGDLGTWLGRGTYGRRFTNRLEVLASATLGGSAGETLRFSGLGGGDVAVSGADDERYGSAMVSASRGGLSLFGAYVSREKGIPTAAFGTLVGDSRTRTWDDRTLAALKYEGRLSPRWEGFARAHYGHYDFRGHYGFGDVGADLELDRTVGEWWGLDAGLHSEAIGRHVLSLGGELQDNLRQDQSWRYATDPGPRLDARNRSRRWALYGEDELRLTPELALHGGLRYDHGPASGKRVSPRAGLVWTRERSTLKLVYGTAFRAPNEYERHFYPGSDGLQPEAIRTLEVVGERYIGPAWRLSAALFHNGIEHLIALRETGDQLVFANAGGLDSRGFEVGAEAKLRGGMRGQLTYSHQRTYERQMHEELSNSPRHLLKLQLTSPIVEERLGAAIDLQYMSGRHTLAGGRAPAFAVANLTLRAARLVGGLDAALSVRNLFDARYSDPGSEEHAQDVLPQPRRSLQGRLTWRF